MKPIRTRRHELGLTQVQLAGLSGVNQTTISRLEQDADKGGVTLEVAQRLALALRTPLDDLFPPPAVDVG